MFSEVSASWFAYTKTEGSGPLAPRNSGYVAMSPEALQRLSVDIRAAKPEAWKRSYFAAAG
jgi:hypothetical protein